MTISIFDGVKISFISDVLWLIGYHICLTSIAKHLLALLGLLFASACLVDVDQLVHNGRLVLALVSAGLGLVELLHLDSAQLSERLLACSPVTLASVALFVQRRVELLFQLADALCQRLFALSKEVRRKLLLVLTLIQVCFQLLSKAAFDAVGGSHDVGNGVHFGTGACVVAQRLVEVGGAREFLHVL